MSSLSFLDSPDWFTKPEEERDQATSLAFQNEVNNSPGFSDLADTEKQGIYTLFRRKVEQAEKQHPSNPINIEAQRRQTEVDNNNSAHNLWDRSVNSVYDVIDAYKSVDDFTTGNFGTDYGERTAKAIQRRKELGTPRELKELTAIFTKATKEMDVAKTTTAKALSVFNSVIDVGENIIENPMGAAYLTADTISSLGVSMIGGIGGAEAGAALGAPLGPVGSAVTGTIGGITGMFLANLPPEAQGKFVSIIETELAGRGLEPTAQNIDALVADSSFRNPALKKARTKAVVTAGVDTGVGLLTAGVGGKLLKGAKTLTGKAAVRAGQLAAETIGEPLSEGLGTYAAGDKVELGELLAETVGGLGMSPVSTAIDQAALGGSVALDKTKDVLAPKTDTQVKAEDILKSDRKFGYKEEVSVSPEKADLTKISDPASTDYNPIKAVEALRNINTEEAYDKAVDVFNDYSDQLDKVSKEATPLSVKINEGTATKEESKRFRQLKKQHTSMLKVGNKIKSHVTALDASLNESAPEPSTIDVKSSTDADIKESITKTLGSSRSSNRMTNEDLVKLSDRDDLEAGTKDLIDNVIDLNVAKSNLSNFTQQKNMGDVQQDIFSGGKGFKGIDTYNRGIAKAIKEGDIDKANKHLAGLTKFANIQADKASVLNEIYSLAQKGQKPTTELQKQFDLLKQTKGSNLKAIHKGSGDLVKSIDLESKVLSKAASVASKLVNNAQSTSKVEKSKTDGPKSTPKEKTPVKDAKLTVFTNNVKSSLIDGDSDGNLKILNGIKKTRTDADKVAVLDKLIKQEELNAKKEVETQSETEEKTTKEEAPKKFAKKVESIEAKSTIIEPIESLEAMRAALGDTYTSKNLHTAFGKVDAKKFKVKESVLKSGTEMSQKLSATMQDGYIRWDTQYKKPDGTYGYLFTMGIEDQETTLDLTENEFNIKTLSKRIADKQREYDAKPTKSRRKEENRAKGNSNRSGNVQGDTVSRPKQPISAETYKNDDGRRKGVDEREGESDRLTSEEVLDQTPADTLGFDAIEVIVTKPDGTETQVIFDEAMQNIEDEIALYEKIRKCVNGK